MPKAARANVRGRAFNQRDILNSPKGSLAGTRRILAAAAARPRSVGAIVVTQQDAQRTYSTSIGVVCEPQGTNRCAVRAGVDVWEGVVKLLRPPPRCVNEHRETLSGGVIIGNVCVAAHRLVGQILDGSRLLDSEEIRRASCRER